MSSSGSSILDKQIVLKLNANYQAVAFITIKEAVTFLCSEQNGEHPGFALDCEMGKNEEGNPEMSYSRPVAWEDWVKLPVRDSDLAINTGRGQIRAPLIVVCSRYRKVPQRTTRWSTGNVHKRDNYTCGYTGERLTHSTASVDHVIPRSRGGRDSFENTVSCHKRINLMKANRTPEEAGLKLLRKPKAPPTLPVVITVEEAKHPTHKPFLL